jgi:hypothetical protein
VFRGALGRVERSVVNHVIIIIIFLKKAIITLLLVPDLDCLRLGLSNSI